MKRASFILVATVLGATLGPVSVTLAQTTDQDTQQALEVLEITRSGRGVLLPLDGALAPEGGAGQEAGGATAEPDSTTQPADGSTASDVTDKAVATAIDQMASTGADTASGDSADKAAASAEADAGSAAVDTTAAASDASTGTDTASGGASAAATSDAGTASGAADLGNLASLDGIATAELGNPDTMGPYRLWLASFRTVREAQAGWIQLAKDNFDVLGDLTPIIVMKELGADNGTFFRLQAGPMQTEVAARDRCSKLKDRDLYCAVVGP